ncbi:MAG: VOC family protein [Bryobacterales bacterium]|nr:VOC family protein [Bryobacterales bacterium]
MKVIVMVKATASSEAGEMPSQQLLTEMGKYNEALVDAGIMKAGEGLKPSSAGARVQFRGKDRAVVNGPFAETNELVAGFWLWNVRSLEEAVDWVKRCPNPMLEDSEIEIRPIYELEDFAELDPDGAVRAQEENLMHRIALSGSHVQPYLFFGGRCEEAIGFYKRTLGAVVGVLFRFNESPEPAPEGLLPPGFENKIMHAEIQVGDVKILVSDGCHEAATFVGFRLALTVPTVEDADRTFDALAEGGTIDMPICQTFWSPRYGQVTDKFGVGWMVTVPPPNPMK